LQHRAFRAAAHPTGYSVLLGYMGSAVVNWYDRRRLYRLHPDLLAAGNHGPFGQKEENYLGRSLVHGAP
jgi:hypothetical protein